MAIEYIIIDNERDLMGAIHHCIEKGMCCFDYETSPTKDYRRDFLKEEIKSKPGLKKPATDTSYAEICTLSFAPTTEVVYIVPISHKIGKNYKGNINPLFLVDKYLFRNESVTKIAHNLPFEAKFTTAFGGMLMGTCIDSMHLLIRLSQVEGTDTYPLMKGMGLKEQTLEKFGVRMEEFMEVTEGVNHFDETDIMDSFTYSGDDSIYSLMLHDYAKEKLEAVEIPPLVNGIDLGERPYKNYYDFLVDVECAVLRVIGMMEHNGIGFGEGYIPSLEKAKKLKTEALDRIIAIGVKHGVTLSPGSNGKTKSVKEFLFKNLRCPVYFKTDKGAPSLDTPSLKKLIKTIKCNVDKPEKLDVERFVEVGLRQLDDGSVIVHHNRESLLELLEAIMHVQTITTLISSHMEGRLKYASLEDGRIRSNYDLYPETGRFASSKPNMQNVSKDNKSPISVRGLHKPEADSLFIAIDFSAQEVRVGADMYQDEAMKRNILEGIDMHSYSANTIFKLGLTMEELESGMRAEGQYRNPAKIGQ